MLQILALCLLFWAAVAATRALHRERAVFLELGQTTAAQWLVWLYPLPFALPLLHRPLLGPLFYPIPFSALFFAPAVAVAMQNLRRFDRSGDDRVKSAAAAADYVVTAGVLGIMGTLAFTGYLWLRR